MKKTAEHPSRRTRKTTRRTAPKSRTASNSRTATKSRTASKSKNGAKELYITYDLPGETRSGLSVLYPKFKRIYITGKVSDWRVGGFANRMGRQIHGVKIEYEQGQSRSRARRDGQEEYKIRRGNTVYKVLPLQVAGATSHFSQIVEVPKDAQNVKLYAGKLPRKYQATGKTAR
jgi:hypothetical protein